MRKGKEKASKKSSANASKKVSTKAHKMKKGSKKASKNAAAPNSPQVTFATDRCHTSRSPIENPGHPGKNPAL